MQSLWSDAEAREAVRRWGSLEGCNEDLALRVYTSRLIGRQSALVLHGGGNTSVKTRLPDERGELVDVLCVKGSGWDLGDIEPAGFPAVRLSSLGDLHDLERLDDEAMVNAARTRLLDSTSPNPSVEVLVHAFLPHKFIDHSHADAVLALADQAGAAELCSRVFGSSLVVVPYIMPGFTLAKQARARFESDPDCEGLFLVNHGLFTFGSSARQSYERHIDAVSKAEAYARERIRVFLPPDPAPAALDYGRLAPLLRGRLARVEGGAEGDGPRRYVLRRRTSPRIESFLARDDLASIARRGPATPDHVIRTKATPLVLALDAEPDRWTADIDRALSQYRTDYHDYFFRQTSTRGLSRVELDPDPRVLLVRGIGLVTVGANVAAADIAADIYEHTIDVIEAAESVGSYRALDEDHLFDMEYWSLEQAKLGKKAPKPLSGRVVLITGAAGGIGAATARAFASAGAHLMLVDRDEPALAALAISLGAAHAVVDVERRSEVLDAVANTVETFGGLDGIVSNAGTAPQAPIYACPPETLERSLSINLLAHQWLAAAACDVLRAQGTGGFLSFNASKAAFNPGPGFGPYAVAKAGLVALMKQYALEGGAMGIRANAINADRVRTGLLPPEVVEARAAARGLSADDYFRSNLLQREVTADDVAAGFLHLALAQSTTGAVLTIDGGNIAASPR